MDSARPSDSPKLLSLQDAAQKLAVEPSVLLKWNEQNILKPTITVEGKIGYTEAQLAEFLTIRQLFQKTASSQITTQVSETNSPAPLPNSSTTAQTDSSNELNNPAESSVSPEANQTKKPFKFPSSTLVSISAIVILLILFLVCEKPLAEKPNNSTLSSSGNRSLKTSSLNVSEPVNPNISFASENSGSEDKNIGVDNTSKNTTFAKALSPETPSNVSSQAGQLTRGNSPQKVVENASNSAKIADSQTNGTDNISGFASVSNPNDSESNSNHSQIKPEEEIASIQSKFEALSQSSLENQGASSNNQLVLLLATVIAAPFIFNKQLLNFGKKSTAPKAKNLDILPQIEKIFEVSQKMDGTVVVCFKGREFKICKPELYSESDRFIEKLMKKLAPDMKQFEYGFSENIEFTTPLSRLVTRLGFVGIKRELFFPRTSKDRVLFRQYVTADDLENMGLSEDDILTELAPV